MPRKIEKNARSKEEALQLAAEEFGVPVEELSFTVEREIGKGILGRLLGREVIISAWITKEAEEEQRIRETRELRRKKMEQKEAAKQAEPKAAPADRPASKPQRQPRPKKSESAPVKKAEPKPAPKQEAVSKEKELSPAEAKRREVTEKSVADAQYFAENVIHMMGLEDAQVVAKNGGKAVDVTVTGERMGLLIGKRGDTLDAVQYLTSLYVNKEKNSYIKVNIDTEGYRAKREETLVKLAKSLERKVVREGREVTLEPMSPNERRIIHAALQNSTDVKTYSVGDEPNRKVVVALQD